MKVTEEDITELREFDAALAGTLGEVLAEVAELTQNLEETKTQLRELQEFKAKMGNLPVPVQVVYQPYPVYQNYPYYQQYYVYNSNPTPFSVTA